MTKSKAPKKNKRSEPLAGDSNRMLSASPEADVLANKALAAGVDPASIEKQLEQLTPEEAEMFIRALAITLKRRRFMLIGYLLALVAVLFGMVTALYIYGTSERGTFIGWVFLLPPGLAALFIYGFGRYSRKIE